MFVYSCYGERENSWMNATLLKERERQIEKVTFCNFCLIQFNEPFQERANLQKSAKSCKSFLKLLHSLSHTLLHAHTHFSHSLTCTHTHSHFLSLSHSHTHSESFFLVGSFSWRMQWKSELGYFLNSSQRVTSSTPWLVFRRHLSGR